MSTHFMKMLYIELCVDRFYVISFIRNNLEGTKYIMPADCVIQHVKRIQMPEMVMS